MPYTLFFAFSAAFFAVLVISYWANKLGGGLSCMGMVLTGLISFVAAVLFLLLAPENWHTPAMLVGVGIIAITLIVLLITGN